MNKSNDLMDIMVECEQIIFNPLFIDILGKIQQDEINEIKNNPLFIDILGKIQQNEINEIKNNPLYIEVLGKIQQDEINEIKNNPLFIEFKQRNERDEMIEECKNLVNTISDLLVDSFDYYETIEDMNEKMKRFKYTPTPTSLLIKNKLIGYEPEFIKYKLFLNGPYIYELDVEDMKNRLRVKTEIKLIYMFDKYVSDIMPFKQRMTLLDNMKLNNVEFIYDDHSRKIGFMSLSDDQYVNYFYLDLLYKQFMKPSNRVELLVDGDIKYGILENIRYESDSDSDSDDNEYAPYDYISYLNHFNILNKMT